MSNTTHLPEHSISEAELSAAADVDRLNKLQVIETAQGFYVLAKLSGRPTRTHYMATRRVPDQPRMFRDLKRLNELLRSIYPHGPIELTCEQPYTGKPVKKVTKKKITGRK